jgi:hypothetical protein
MLAIIARPAAADPVRPGAWLWNCDGAAYRGAHEHGFYTHECLRDIGLLPGGSPPDALRGAFHVFPWAQVEPEDGRFDWTEVDANLTALAQHGVQVVPSIWIHKAAAISGMTPTPEWLFQVSPSTPYEHVRGKPPVLHAPSYLNPVFQQRFTRLIDAFAQHLNTLPLQVRENIWAVESSVGITGDSRPWKGVPVNASQDIDEDAWIAYSRKMQTVYVKAFAPTGIPVLANMENPGFGTKGLKQGAWFLNMSESYGMKGASLKQGTVSHGYNLNGELDLYKEEGRPLMLTPRKDGSYPRSRGELALEPDAGLPGSYGNWATSPAWSLQANAEWALTYGLDTWNLYAGWFGNASFAETLAFFNRHAGHKDVKTAPAAFISFRDSLNTENTRRWPVSKYGPVDSPKNPTKMANTARMTKIVKEHRAFGARLDDPAEAADHRSVIQKKGNYLSDVCWKCWNTNYARYIEQIKPYETSVGWWQQGPRDQAYGRFARGLQHATNRNMITMRMHDGLHVRNATVRVVYLDRNVHGIWSLGVNGKTVLTVTCKGTGRWVAAEAQIDVVDGGDVLTIWSPDRKDSVFSLLEVYSQ